MKFSQTLNDAFLEQILLEFHNEMVYKAIEIYFDKLFLTHIASFFHKQSHHERHHAVEIIHYLDKRTGGDAKVGQIQPANITINSLNDVAEIFIKTEEATTESIESLFELASDEKSYMDIPFISHFLNKQVDEEHDANKISSMLLNAKDLVLLDKMFKKNKIGVK